MKSPKGTLGTWGRQNQPTAVGLNRSTPAIPKVVTPASNGRKGRQALPMATGARGQKRIAHDVLPGPQPRRQRPNTPALKTAKPTNAPVPTAEQYPDLPPGLFDSPKAFLHEKLRAFARFSSKFSPRNGLFRCTLTCSFKLKDRQEGMVTEGQASSQVGIPDAKAAERLAYLHLGVKCRDHENLKATLWLEVDRISDTVLKEEKDAKLDIYNYAARFDAVPDISERTVPAPGYANGRNRIHEITVKLPEHNIEATGRGVDQRSAEIAAALRFKEAAEKYQASRGGQALVIKDSDALTTENSSKFFDFYKTKHRNASIEVKRDYGQGMTAGRANYHPAQITLNGQPIGQAVTMNSKQKAETLAFLTAAIEIKKKEPELFPEFVRALAAGNGMILRPVNPVNLIVDEDCQLVMRETLLSARKAGLPDVVDQLVSDEQEVSQPRRSRPLLSPSQLAERARYLEQKLQEFLADPKFSELRRKKEELPMNQNRAKVLDLVSKNPYSIIVGATGSGKTTQVPQIILEDATLQGNGATCNIVCTQPRRIAATSVARRVAVERAEKLQESVGYRVRFDSKLPQFGGSITYCTTGTLLQQLQHQPDEVMNNISHLVIDEVHERDLLTDFLLILLKKAMSERLAFGKATPKVVLMSATMDTELFARYFQAEVEGKQVDCPSLSVPGRTYPVREKYLEEIQKELDQAHPRQAYRLLQTDHATTDYLTVENEFKKQNPNGPKTSMAVDARLDDFAIDWKSERKLNAEGEAVISTEKDDALIPFALVATTIAHIAKTTDQGAILVFLPGLEELVEVKRLLDNHPLGVDFHDASKYKVYLLHSSIPAAQTEVFNEVPPGCRKIILSTNIAETSVTIPDVQYVVDSGKLREKQYDQNRRITQLKSTWISKSNSKQRAGRAGRVQNGNYYALFSAERFHSLRAVGLPEMLRTDLQETCLDIKAQAINYPIRDFLAEALEPPPPKTVDASVLNLQALDALTAEEQITPLGRLLASLPVHPSLGKMIVLGVVFRCLDPMLIIGAAAGERNLFVQPIDMKRAAKEVKHSYVRGSASDHVGLLNAIRDLREIRDTQGERAMLQYAHENFIHANAFRTIDSTARQIEGILIEAGLIPPVPSHMRNGSEYGDESLNENSSKVPLIKALTVAGFHPNLAVSTGTVMHRTPGEAFALIHPTSVNHVTKSLKSGRGDGVQSDNGHTPSRYGSLYTYSAMARGNDNSSVMLRDTTACTPLMAALFGGELTRRADSNSILVMDHWLPFFAKPAGEYRKVQPISSTILDFKAALQRLLAGAFMDLKQSRRREGEAEGRFLAEDEVRRVFADGLVQVLDLDGGTARADGTVNQMRSRPSARPTTFGEYAGMMDKTARTGGSANHARPRSFGAGGTFGDYASLMAKRAPAVAPRPDESRGSNARLRDEYRVFGEYAMGRFG
ncbi:MAG: hypothetical protein L6R39_005245 [Caloplaca ligustica]|nr:MAG: hypothetical protein L6R39_005245 [Caloplaca ligustica]